MSTLSQLRRLGLDPKRSLGQNFLVDEHHLDRIVAAAELTPGDRVLEIGPGLGGLTVRLAARAGCVVAVELDNRFIAPLAAQFAAAPHVHIVHGDILTLDPPSLLTSCPPFPINQSTNQPVSHPPPSILHYKVVANLPYYITSAVLRHLLEAEPRPACAVLLVQKEVGERICAGPGDMSLLAISVQFYAQPRLVHRVPAGAFHPRPKVDSVVLRLDSHAALPVADVAAGRFFAVVRAGFSQKRKQLANSLSAGLFLPKDAVIAALGQAGIDPRRRPETLALEEWRQVCLVLDAAVPAPEA